MGERALTRVRRRVFDVRYGILSVIVLLALLQLLSSFFPPYLMPDVGRLLGAVSELVLTRGEHLVDSLWRFLRTMAAALAIGWLLGILMASQRRLGEFAEPFLKVVMATPALSWILLAVIWFRGIEIRVAFVIVLLVMPFYAVAVFEAIKGMGNDLVAAIQQFRPTRPQTLALLLLPFSVAIVIATTKSVSGFAMRILIFAELIASNSGVGWLMGRAQANFQVEQIFALTAIAVIFNFVFLWFVGLVERYVLRWRPETALRS